MIGPKGDNNLRKLGNEIKLSFVPIKTETNYIYTI